MEMAGIRSLLLVSMILLLVSIGTVESRRSGKSSSVFSLFNLKEKSKFWSEAVIRGDFDDLEASSPSKTGVYNYTKAGNIANYLNLMEVDSMYLPVPVNYIFMGFDGKGNQEFTLRPEELERWFTKIDHVFAHTRIPQIGELITAVERVIIDKKQHHHFPVISHVKYNFSVHAIQMGEKVTTVFERAINVLARKDDVSGDRNDTDSLWQVDADMMDVLFTSLVEYLQLEDAYNIFILNPRRDSRIAKYGYRRGLSESEIALLKKDKYLQSKILQAGNTPGNVLGMKLTALDNIKKPLYGKHPMVKFAWTVTEEADTVCPLGPLLNSMVPHYIFVEWHNICLDALMNVEKLYQGKTTAEIIQNKVSQLLNGKNEDMKLLLQKDLKSGDFNDYHEECLTDTWIGKDRWAFIDLTAGPFSWGPAVGGEGVRTELSLPNVGKTIGAVEVEISEDEAEDRLQDAIQEKFAVFGDKDHQAIDILLAEIDIYELFAFKHCKGRKIKLALCDELDERMRDLKDELQSFENEEYDESHRRKAVDALKRMESWNLFSDTHEEFQNYTVARDTFLAQLGATLWGSVRHIISPSVADGAFHYYEKISYQLFFITKEEMEDMNGSLHEMLLLALSEDPALAMAFSVARRAAAVPYLLVNGTYRKSTRSYIDSSILQYQLRRLNTHGSLKGSHAHSRSTLEVPIFWFIHTDPLLVDKHYQAKALSDMVIVVQSESSSWESHLQCNGKSLLWDLRRPIKPALAAVSEHLAGLLPLQLVYSHAHGTAIEV
ncbi:transmembrane protein [Gossypium australe]|uniref:Transmembrane protein n=3 Tax=Gossypium TaxID=3633 RepID=A0A5B6VRE3_9ROSI|nr:transmembrane protein [Gossypium australe]